MPNFESRAGRTASSWEVAWTAFAATARSLLRARWFTLGAVLTITVAIGLNIAVLSVVDRTPYVHQPRFQAVLFGSLAVAGLLMSAIGLLSGHGWNGCRTGRVLVGRKFLQGSVWWTLVTVTAAAASWWPARIAGNVDPSTSLRAN